MKMALTAVLEAFFSVLGEPDLKHRQCLLAMYKWTKLVVVEHQVALPGDYVAKIHSKKECKESCFCPRSFKDNMKIYETNRDSSLGLMLDLLLLYVMFLCTST